MSDTTARSLKRPLAPVGPDDCPGGGGLEVHLGPDIRPVIDEASRLTGERDPSRLIRIALKEMIERRRFQNWVEARDTEGALSGRA